MPNARNVEKCNGSLAKGQAESGYNKGTIRSDIRYLVLSKDVRRHRLISSDYIKTLYCHCNILASTQHDLRNLIW